MIEIYEIVKAVNRLKERITDLTAQVEFLSKSPSQKLSAKWLDTEAACAILHVSDRTLMKMRNEGDLPFTRIRRRIFYQASDINEYIENKLRIKNCRESSRVSEFQGFRVHAMDAEDDAKDAEIERIRNSYKQSKL